jgi:hypothetical protein
VRPPAVEGGVYSNSALYSNMGADPLYSNVAEVCFNLILELKLNFKINLGLNIISLQPGDYNSLLEIPGGVRLVARSAEPVARGLGSARPSAIQPPAGIRPLQLTSEVRFTY